jgi:SAM-dependent methyltransferase
MDRRAVLLKGITKDMLGIEIGPYHQPLVPKREGYRSLSLDVFDTETLRRNAAADSAITKKEAEQIEEVDLVGSAPRLAEIVETKGLVGQCDYIISSHNLEHIPDPIRFLQGCEKALKPQGFLSMAVPDKRCCFDYYRPLSMTGDLLEAYFEKRERPSRAQIFQVEALDCRFRDKGVEGFSFDLGADPALIEPFQHLKGSFDNWQASFSAADVTYRDSHCWAMTPSSFELIAREIQFLGLTKLGIESVTGPHGNEFYIRFVNGAPVPESAEFYARRAALLREIASASDNGVLRRANAALKAELDAIKRSKSWRITAPLRWLRMMPRKGLAAAPFEAKGEDAF